MMYADILYLALLAVIARLLYDAAEPDDDSEKGIPTCSRCGSRDLNLSSTGRGFINPGGDTSTRVSCNDCGWVGPLFLLDDEWAYYDFLEKIKEDPDRAKRIKGLTPGIGK